MRYLLLVSTFLLVSFVRQKHVFIYLFFSSCCGHVGGLSLVSPNGSSALAVKEASLGLARYAAISQVGWY